MEIRDRQLLVGGTPSLVLAGEVHYFRLARSDWQDRLDKLKEAGCTTVASYIPWLCHEPERGVFDLTGRTRPEYDVGAFIDLCRDNDLDFIARPGPFVMAELKNEGVPHWVYQQLPEAVPVSWHGLPVPTSTLDYLQPGFLAAAEAWYAAVMPLLAARLYPHGNVTAVQLDNEIGMLSWVSRAPDLSDLVLDELAAWLQQRYGAQAESRYPFLDQDKDARNQHFRAPGEADALPLLRDLGHYMRARFARYVAALRGFAEQCGVTGVPFLINIHGTEGGRGLSYPIGISQLYESYTQAPGYLAGSDHYLGDLTLDNAQDLYLSNAFMAAVNRPEQPLSSLEFQCSTGNYAQDHGGRYDPMSLELKTRLCVAQGNRLINYYLFCGGVNPPLAAAVGDGNDRIAFTGERHGFGAPIDPEGHPNYTFAPLKRIVHTMRAVADKLAVTHEEHDALAFAFIPDYFMTEVAYPESAEAQRFVANLTEHRAGGAWSIVARALLLAGYRFGAHDVQNRPLNPAEVPLLVLPSARYLDAAVQQNLVGYLEAGGKMFLYGEVPQYDMEGRPCRLLADALGVKVGVSRYASSRYFPSLVAEGWAAPRPEVRTHACHELLPARGEVFMRLLSGEVCGLEVTVGAGRAVVLSATYICDVSFFRDLCGRLGAVPSLTHDHPEHGVVMTSSAAPVTGHPHPERFVHLLNLDGFDKALRVYQGGAPLFGGRTLCLGRREGLLLPLNVTFGAVRVVYATAELAAVTPNTLSFTLTQDEDSFVLATTRTLEASPHYAVRDHPAGYEIVPQNGRKGRTLTVAWR